jgi:PAS domain S-box-containing protein
MPSRKPSDGAKPVRNNAEKRGTVHESATLKSAEQALRESEENFRVLFEENPLPTILSELPSGRIAFVNKRLAAILGLPPEAIVGKTANDLGLLKNPSDQQKLTALITGQGYVDNVEVDRVSREGRHGTDLVFMRIVTISGKPYCLTVLQDVTERKRAETALHESEARFQKIVEQAPIAMAIVGMDSTIEYINRKAVTVFGYPHQDIPTMDRWWVQAYPDAAYREEVVADWTGRVQRAIVEDREIAGNEYRTTCKDGSVKTMFISGVPVANKIFVMFDDITERKLAEEALRRSEDRYRRLVETTATGYVIVDTKGGVLDANLEYVRLSGHQNLNEIVGRSVVEWTADEEKESNAQAVATCLRKGFIRNFEVTYVDRTGKRTPVEINATVMEKEGKQQILTLCRDITERKHAETSLRLRESYLSAIIENQPGLLWLKDRDGRFLAVNTKFSDSSGMRNSEALVGRTDFDIWPQELAAGYVADDDKVIKSGKPFIVEEPIADRGKIRWFETFKAPIFDKQGVVIGTTGFSRDITERKRAEDALRESEERFSKAFKTSPYSYVIANMEDGAIIEVNDAFTTISGFTREEALGISTLTLNFWVIEEDRKRMVANLRDSGVVERMETKLRGKNGNIVTALLFARMIKLGNRMCILSIMEDITTRKRAEEAVAAEKERLSVTLRSIGDGVITTDISGCIVIMNKVAEEITGWTQREAQGRPLDEVFTIVNEITRQPCENPVAKVLSTGKVIELANHTLLVARDGTQRVIADSGAPIKDGDGTTVGVVLVFRDMTEKQKTMEAIQRAAKLDSLGILAGGIAHDFNNLLTGIFGYISLSRSVAKDARAVEYLDATMASMNRARALTQQLLTFAKGGAPVQKTTPLVPFIKEAAQFALSGSNISCTFSLAPDLRHCNIDKNQIGQVIDNLVINAQQAMPGGGALEITAANLSFGEKEHPALARGDYVKVSIKDFGIGIPKEIIPRIFDPFYTTKSKGHGLGLATCYSIINRHGGCIDVESEPGKGSTFHVYLPASMESAAGISQAIVNHRGSGTILVMDDEDAVRTTVRAMLETLGYSVVCRNSGRDAVDFYVNETKANRKFAALMFDLTVAGGMGGIQAVAEIRKLNKDIPVFVVSGYADNSALKDPGAFGFTAGLSKPFTVAELSELLSKYVR